MPGDKTTIDAAIAYLNSEYPSLSHTFIELEVRELRRLGMRIDTFSVRAAGQNGRLGDAHRAAAKHTCVLRAGLLRLAGDFCSGLLRSPVGVMRALLDGQRLSPPGLVSRFRHVAYVVQGVRLALQMSRRGIRHVHVHMANNGAAIAMMACCFDRRLSYSLSIHGSAEFFHVDSWTLAPKVERAMFVRCISDFCRAQVMAWTDPACWQRLHVVRCGIDTGLHAPSGKVRSGPLRLLTVGRLHPIKGYEILLRACAQLAREGLPWHLDMVGDGQLLQELKTTASALEIADRISFSGAVEQERIGDHFNEADVLIVSSFMEGIPVVLMEAMSRQIAVVATRVGGIPELVRDGIDGLLVSPGSVQALMHALWSLMQEPNTCERLGSQGRARVLEQYSLGTLGNGMLTLFSDYGMRV